VPQDLAKESSRNVILLDDLKAEIEKPADAEIEKLILEEEGD
jgi:hypothetical protein